MFDALDAREGANPRLGFQPWLGISSWRFQYISNRNHSFSTFQMSLLLRSTGRVLLYMFVCYLCQDVRPSFFSRSTSMTGYTTFRAKNVCRSLYTFFQPLTKIPGMKGNATAPCTSYSKMHSGQSEASAAKIRGAIG